MTSAKPSTELPTILPDGRRLYLVELPTGHRLDRCVLAYGHRRDLAIRAAEDQHGGVARSARLVR